METEQTEPEEPRRNPNPPLEGPIAILADVHADLPALEAVLADIDSLGVTRVVSLGDIVGYGWDAEECVSLIRARCQVSVVGNHDRMAFILQERQLRRFPDDIGLPLLHAREQLSPDDLAWLGRQPLVDQSSAIEFSHASLHEPGRFHYVQSPEDAALHFEHATAPISFFGHTHLPVLWRESADCRRQPEAYGPAYGGILLDRSRPASCRERGKRGPAARRRRPALLCPLQSRELSADLPADRGVFRIGQRRGNPMSVAPRGRPLWKGRIFSGRGPGNRPPSRDDDGRRDGPPPRPFYIFWFGDLHGMPSDDDLPVDDVDGWMHEMSAKVRAMGLRHYEIYPWRFEIVRIDPDTGRWADVTRREFFEVQRFFERMNEKYGFRMGGAYQHIRKLAGQKEEAHSEMYAKGVLKYGAMNGRPWHARLKGRDERKRRR